MYHVVLNMYMNWSMYDNIRYDTQIQDGSSYAGDSGWYDTTSTQVTYLGDSG